MRTIFQKMYRIIYIQGTHFLRIYTIIYIQSAQFFKKSILSVQLKKQFFKQCTQFCFDISVRGWGANNFFGDDGEIECIKFNSLDNALTSSN